MNLFDRKIISSRYISGGHRVHRLSPFLESEVGRNSVPADELVFSSSLLWQNSRTPFEKPRFSMGFPEEYRAFVSHAKDTAIFEKVSLDLWVFKNINLSDLGFLIDVLDSHKSFRLVIAPSYLFDWEAFLETPEFLRLKDDKKILISFLPRKDRLSPFLRQHDVLHAIARLDQSIEILNLNLGVDPKLSPEAWASQLAAESRLMIFFVKALEKTGLSDFTMSFINALDLAVSGELNKLTSTIKFFCMGLFHLLKKFYNLFRFRIIPILFWPLFKAFWFCEYQFKKMRSRGKIGT